MVAEGGADQGMARKADAVAQPAAATSPSPSPLALLLQYIAQVSAGPGAELKAVQQFGQRWALLRTTQQLSRSLAQAPDQAGPLNSHRLMLQTLQRLQALSPAYLQQFLAHAEALLWLEQAAGGGRPVGQSTGADGKARRHRRQRER